MRPLQVTATLTDVAFAVCTALEEAGEHAVLCGGSAATYYAPEAYESDDLDFVLRFGARRSAVDEALAPLGYVRAPGDLYRHPHIIYTLEFPAGPLAIGSETVSVHATDRRDGLFLHVYLPTDVVRDRFMHYWAWGDQRALRVALAVAAARRTQIDATAIEAWADRELRAEPILDRFRRDHFVAELRRALRN
jgi:hypothetical protein